MVLHKLAAWTVVAHLALAMILIATLILLTIHLSAAAAAAPVPTAPAAPANPGLARNVYRAFLQAKDAAAEQYRDHRRWYEVQHMLPWTNALFERNEQLLGDDWWPYGVSANRKTVDTYLRYHYEQGLSARRWTVDEIFSADLLNT